MIVDSLYNDSVIIALKPFFYTHLNVNSSLPLTYILSRRDSQVSQKKVTTVQRVYSIGGNRRAPALPRHDRLFQFSHLPFSQAIPTQTRRTSGTLTYSRPMHYR